MTYVDLNRISKRYAAAPTAAVDDLSVHIDSGELLALLGPSGCGKTTTLKMIAGLLAPDSGDIRFDGQSIINLQAEQRRAAMVFQNHLLFAHMNVFDNIGFGLRMRGNSRQEITRQVESMLERVQLDGFGTRQPHELSGGQSQRVALARALVTNPNLLLLDEPLSNLDADLRNDMRQLICELQRDTAVTTIMVTHDQDDSTMMADRIALMMDGRLKQHADAASIINAPVDEQAARFFGNENFITGQVINGQFECALGLLKLQQIPPDNAKKLTIRAENIELVAHGANSADSANTLDATLNKIKSSANYAQLTLASRGIELAVVCHQREIAGKLKGEKLSIRLPENYLWVF